MKRHRKMLGADIYWWWWTMNMEGQSFYRYQHLYSYNTHVPMSTTALFVLTKSWKQPQCPYNKRVQTCDLIRMDYRWQLWFIYMWSEKVSLKRSHIVAFINKTSLKLTKFIVETRFEVGIELAVGQEFITNVELLSLPLSALTYQLHRASQSPQC